MEVANALVYYDMATITALKSFIVEAPAYLASLSTDEWKKSCNVDSSGSSADTVRSSHSVKSVTIAPKVTEFHYAGKNHSFSQAGPSSTSY